jgi:hypothetical protein
MWLRRVSPLCRALPAVLLAAALLQACAASPPYVMTGPARTPVPPEQVLVLSQPPPQFVDVAIIHASGKSLNPGSQAAFDKVVQRLRQQAGALGANAIILEGFSDRQSASIGTGVGSTSYGAHSAVGVGVGGGFGIYSKTGQAHAVFIPPDAPRPMPLVPPSPSGQPAR